MILFSRNYIIAIRGQSIINANSFINKNFIEILLVENPSYQISRRCHKEDSDLAISKNILIIRKMKQKKVNVGKSRAELTQIRNKTTNSEMGKGIRQGTISSLRKLLSKTQGTFFI